MSKRLALLLLLAAAVFGAELTGVWTGTFEDVAPDGSVRNTTAAYMQLKLAGQTVSGTAGRSESDQRAISNGKLEGKRLTFDLAQPQGFTMKFDLTFDGETIKGTASAERNGERLSARLDLKRKPQDRPEDRAAIRAHIDRIFQAFIHKDSNELRATHAANWLGYLEGSRTMIRGVEGYMDYSGYFDPKGEWGMIGYKMREFDMIFHGDAAFVAFVADVEAKTPGGPFMRTLRITDFYTKRNGAWIQTGSDTDLHPESQDKQNQAFRTLSEGEKKSLLAAREAVWRAWFGGDRAALEKLLPEELVTLDPDGGEWSNRKAVLESSANFAAGGGKLVRLEFPRTEIQAYGSTAIVYSKYRYELEQGGKRKVNTGRVTEVFVRRNGAWVNPSWHMEAARE